MNYKLITEHLIAAKALIADPSVWVNCNPLAFNGLIKHCTMTAIGEVTGGYHEIIEDARNIFKKANNIHNIIIFNDSSTHEQVLVAFDKAIKYAQDRSN